MKIAIVHDWLDASGGAEQVLEQILLCYPQSDVFALVDFMPECERGFLRGRKITTSFIQKIPWARKHFRRYLALMPRGIESFDLSAYDLILSSSWAFAKGVKTNSSQTHVSYIHTPIRYAWELQELYLQQAVSSKLLRILARYFLGRLRDWDIKTASRGDQLIANSQFIAERIQRYWHRQSLVLNPPVASGDFTCAEVKEDFYITVSRLVHYKAVETLVEAFNLMPDKRLVVIGDGPMFHRLQALAGPNVELLGYQSRTVVIDYLQRARAFVFSAHEDFGIVLVEAQACGTPVIAYGQGGALDSVVPYECPVMEGVDTERPATGLFFEEQTAVSVVAAVDRFEALEGGISPRACAANAARFAPEYFRNAFMAIVEQTLENRLRSTQG
ncbi:MAG: glycosyltransferase family 4 protein [Gammaproteobacteria bacterium]|nr:MAG: glycosyltransferase family 4 protein [Gammaproteobacteria bacterium]RLA45861.1 MAG: glycosyltransferase family 4 protein [Gammaproteobacteria bacterium]